MNTYITLLRGINVSGQKLIKMIELKSHFEELGFSDIQTYIQSGNIVFKSSENSVSKLEGLIEAKIKEKYGWDVPTMVKKKEELEYALANNPRAHDETDPKLVFFTFLDQEPSNEDIAKLAEKDYPDEEYIIDGTCIYFHPKNGAGKAKMNNNLFENKLKVRATTRNLRTVIKLIEMGSN